MALNQVPSVAGWGDLAGWTVDLGSGKAASTNVTSDEWGNPIPQRQLSAAELAPYLASWNSPSQVAGRAEAARQDNGPGFNLKGLVNAGIGAGVFGLMGGGALGAFGDAAGAGGITADSIAAGITGGENAAGAMYGAGSLGAGADAAWGVNQKAGGSMFDINDPSTWFNNIEGGENSAFNPSSGFSMPAAVPETPQQLAEWGLKETSPGNWSLPNIPGSSSTAADWITKIASNPSVWGKLLATGLGAYGSNQQANALKGLAGTYQEYGAPSRARFEASMSPGFDPSSIPGYAGALDTASKSILARLSASGGNPWGNPGGLIEANKAIINGTAMPAINEYQRLNANTGFGSSMNAALGLQGQAIGADANVLNALGYGVNAITNPTPSITELLAQIAKAGNYKAADGVSL